MDVAKGRGDACLPNLGATYMRGWCDDALRHVVHARLTTLALVIYTAYVLALNLLVLAMLRAESYFLTPGSMQDLQFADDGKPCTIDFIRARLIEAAKAIDAAKEHAAMNKAISGALNGRESAALNKLREWWYVD